MDIKQRKQLDDIVLDEVNVKQLVRYICTTDLGEVNLIYDGDDYFITLNDQKKYAPKLVEALLKDIN